MPLYIKDDKIDELAKRLALLTKAPSKTEAVRAALQAAIDAQANAPTVVDIAARFRTEIRGRARPGGMPADKAFRDSLYEDG